MLYGKVFIGCMNWLKVASDNVDPVGGVSLSVECVSAVAAINSGLMAIVAESGKVCDRGGYRVLSCLSIDVLIEPFAASSMCLYRIVYNNICGVVHALGVE